MYVAWGKELGWGDPFMRWNLHDKLHRVMALLIATCAQLEELTVSADFLLHNQWFPVMLRYGIASQGEGAASRLFGKLKKVRVTTEYHEEAELWGPDFVRVQNTLLGLFCLPIVESLEIAAFADVRDESGRLKWLEEEDVDENFWPVWPLERRPVAASLTMRKLVRSSVDPRTIERLLQQTPQVKVFEFDCFMYPEHVPLDLDCLREALLRIRSTLTSLTVRYELYHNDGMVVIARDTFGAVTGSLGPLYDFPVLSTLVVSLPVLFCTEDIDMGRQPTLSAYLLQRSSTSPSQTICTDTVLSRNTLKTRTPWLSSALICLARKSAPNEWVVRKVIFGERIISTKGSVMGILIGCRIGSQSGS
jgi:hypothetical protein